MLRSDRVWSEGLEQKKGGLVIWVKIPGKLAPNINQDGYPSLFSSGSGLSHPGVQSLVALLFLFQTLSFMPRDVAINDHVLSGFLDTISHISFSKGWEKC